MTQLRFFPEEMPTEAASSLGEFKDRAWSKLGEWKVSLPLLTQTIP